MPQAASKGGPVIAVVDDDPAVCSSLKFSLELDGFKVRTYDGGAELLQTADFPDVDCLVIDQKMPRMSGFELIAQLRLRQIAVPVILIVSESNLALSARAAKANIPVIEKPFLGNALVDAIRKACACG